MRNNLKTAVLLAGFGGLIMLVGSMFGQGGLTIAFVLALATVGGSYWFSDRLAIAAARAVPASEAELPRYHAIVRDLTTRAGMPMPQLYVTPDLQPNAFATGRNPEHAAVAVTRGLLDLCDESELRGVLAHELSHVANRDILIGSVAAALAMVITFVARMAMWGAMFAGGGGDRERDDNPLGMLAFALLAPFAAGMLQMALSRSREFEADASAARLIGDGEPLARALEKLESTAKRIPMRIDPAQAGAFIVNPLTGRNVQFRNLFTTHPPAQARIERLRTGAWR